MRITRRDAVKMNLISAVTLLFDGPASSAQQTTEVGGGQWLWWDSAILFKMMGKDTSGTTTWMLTEVKPKEGAPLHKHSKEDEIFYVMSGKFEFVVGDKTVVGEPGTCIFGPREVPHRWTNVGSDNGRMLMTFTPAGIEEFFLTLGVPIASPKDTPVINMAALGPKIPAAADKAGLTLVGPKKYPRG